MDIVLNQTSWQKHTCMILAGALELEKKGLIKLKINDYRNCGKQDLGVTEMIVDGKKCIFDVGDGYSDSQYKLDIARACDFYFRRSFSDEKNALYFPDIKNIYPLGLNYYVYSKYQNMNFDTRSSYKKFFRNLLGYKPDKYFDIEFFESIPCYTSTPKIIFFTRLWKPTDDEFAKNNLAINKMRIEIIRRARKKYGEHFQGGVYKNELSEQLCPDIIVSKRESDRYQYINRMHSSDICIGTMGLDESIGWKTAEYVAAGKAIIHEKMSYQVPYGFNKGSNYLEFSSADECIEKIDYLLDNPEKLMELKNNNYHYYLEHLRPDKQILDALKIVKNGT